MNDTVEILYGYDDIGRFLNMTARQAEHRLKASKAPTFKVGRKVAARPAALRAWLADLEKAGTSDADKT